MQRILQNTVLCRSFQIILQVAGALTAAGLFTWASLRYLHEKPTRPSDVSYVAVPAAVVSLVIVLGWQCATRCKQNQHWQRVMATLLYVAMTLSSLWLGVISASWAAPYVDNLWAHGVEFGRDSIWQGERGIGLAFIFMCGLLPAVIIADISFAIHLHVRARSRYWREEYGSGF